MCRFSMLACLARMCNHSRRRLVTLSGCANAYSFKDRRPSQDYEYQRENPPFLFSPRLRNYEIITQEKIKKS